MPALLLPSPVLYFPDLNGAPVVGGHLYTFLPNTTTPKMTWQDQAETISNTNPIVLDERGEATVWGEGTYRFILYSVDEIGNETLIWDKTTTTGDGEFMLVDGSNIDMTEAQKTYFRNYLAMGVVTLTTDTTIDYLDVGANGKVILAGHNLTIGTMADTRRVGIFDDGGGGVVSLLAGDVRPEWWGDIQDTLIKAVAALPSTGGTVLLAKRAYKPNGYVYGSGASVGVALTKDNVSIIGEATPIMNLTCSALVGGSVIQGGIIAYANNLTLSNLGLDSGLDVCTNYFSGTANDALSCTYPNDALKAAAALRLNLRIHNVIGLCKDSVSPVHSSLLEGFSGIQQTGDLTGVYGYYGPVIKSANVVAQSLTAYLNGNQGVYLKSDTQATAQCFNIDIAQINAFANGPPNGFVPHAANPASTNYGVLLDAQGGNIDGVQIGNITENGHAYGFSTNFGTGTVIADVQIGSITTDTNSAAGTYIAAAAGKACARWSIGSVIGRNTIFAFAVNYAVADGGAVAVGLVSGVNCSTSAILVANTAQPVIDCVIADTCAAVYNLNSSGYPSVGQMKNPGTGTIYSTASGGLAPALAGSWANMGGANENFAVDLSGYAVNLRGQISGGGTNTITTLPLWARPGTTRRFSGRGANSGATTEVIVPIEVLNNGVVLVNEVAGTVANCVGGLSLDQVRFQQVF